MASILEEESLGSYERC
jgi:hypothetical protein